MSKHTPGPWITRYPDRVTTNDDTDGTKSIAHIYFPDGRFEGSQEANARLIAAAPEMYEELLNVLKQAEANPFLSVGMLLEHHSKIKEVLATVTDGRGNDDSQ